MPLENLATVFLVVSFSAWFSLQSESRFEIGASNTSNTPAIKHPESLQLFSTARTGTACLPLRP